MIDSSRSAAFAGGPVNILIVDDRPGNLLGYRTILEELGENLLTANSARAALEVVLQKDVAVLLVDVAMRDLDGFELVDMIRAHPRFENLAVIFASGGNGKHLARIRKYSAGAIDYVSVPVVPELLRAKVRVFADLHRKTSQLESLYRDLEAQKAEGRRKDELLTTLAHELRNPLAPILNSVRLLKSGALEPAAVTRNQNLLEQQVHHLVQRVEDLFDPAALDRATVDVAPRRASGHSVASTEMPFVAVDSVRVAGVLSKILDKATKSTPTGSKVLIGLSHDNDDVVLRIGPPPADEPPVEPMMRQPRFLTIDDNVIYADTLTKLLEFSGCHARASYSGEEAIRVGEELEPDVVLLDLVMPSMDGFEAAKRLRQTAWGSRAKLVAVTGLATARHRTVAAGFDGYLEKPVDLDVVLKLVELESEFSKI